LLPPDVTFKGKNAPNSAPDPAGGAYSAPLDFRGLLLREGRGEKSGEEEKGRGGGLSGDVAEEAFCPKSAPEQINKPTNQW